MLLVDVAEKIDRFNHFCIHYNLVANAAYDKLRQVDTPFDMKYRSYIIAALISFDMGRMMGRGLEQKYDISRKGFAANLNIKMEKVRHCIESLADTDISDFSHIRDSDDIIKGYSVLAGTNSKSLNSRGGEFHVGATKILHFINPNLFPIIDSNAAKTLRELYGLGYKQSTQPGYSGQSYTESMATIQNVIFNYGADRFRDLEPNTPIMRVFDKLTFAYGNGW